jgi:signal peptidase II
VYMFQIAVAIVAAILVVAIDQGTKIAAEQFLADTAQQSASSVRFEIVHNPHAGLGRFAVPVGARVIAAGVAAVAALTLIGFFGPFPAVSVVGLGVAIGGGVSNVVDLIARGAVVDFVSLGRWPTFNLADVAVCVGLGLTVIGLV